MIAVDLPGFGAVRDARRGDLDQRLRRRRSTSSWRSSEIDSAQIVGNSMGGFIGAELAISYPERVERLVLVAAAGLSIESIRTERKKGLRHRAENIAVLHLGRLASRSHQVVAAPPAPAPRAAAARRRAPERLPGPLAAEQVAGSGKPGFSDALEAMCRYPLRDRLEKIGCPTLIVWGDKDRLVPLKDASIFEELIPDSRKIIYKDTGHVSMMERPARFNPDVEAFLASRPASRSPRRSRRSSRRKSCPRASAPESRQPASDPPIFDIPVALMVLGGGGAGQTRAARGVALRRRACAGRRGPGRARRDRHAGARFLGIPSNAGCRAARPARPRARGRGLALTAARLRRGGRRDRRARRQHAPRDRPQRDRCRAAGDRRHRALAGRRDALRRPRHAAARARCHDARPARADRSARRGRASSRSAEPTATSAAVTLASGRVAMVAARDEAAAAPRQAQGRAPASRSPTAPSRTSRRAAAARDLARQAARRARRRSSCRVGAGGALTLSPGALAHDRRRGARRRCRGARRTCARGSVRRLVSGRGPGRAAWYPDASRILMADGGGATVSLVSPFSRGARRARHAAGHGAQRHRRPARARGDLGTDGPDEITGTRGRDQIEGLGGDDVLRGGREPRRRSSGGPGNDRLSGGAVQRRRSRAATGNDFMIGGNGDDELRRRARRRQRRRRYRQRHDRGRGRQRPRSTAATATTRSSAAPATTRSSRRASATTRCSTAGPATTRSGAVAAPSSVIIGGEGNDQLYGETGSERILGGEGNDLVDGGRAGDRLEGDEGDDTMLGRCRQRPPLRRTTATTSSTAARATDELLGDERQRQARSAAPAPTCFDGGPGRRHDPRRRRQRRHGQLRPRQRHGLRRGDAPTRDALTDCETRRAGRRPSSTATRRPRTTIRGTRHPDRLYGTVGDDRSSAAAAATGSSRKTATTTSTATAATTGCTAAPATTSWPGARGNDTIWGDDGQRPHHRRPWPRPDPRWSRATTRSSATSDADQDRRRHRATTASTSSTAGATWSSAAQGRTSSSPIRATVVAADCESVRR